MEKGRRELEKKKMPRSEINKKKMSRNEINKKEKNNNKNINGYSNHYCFSSNCIYCKWLHYFRQKQNNQSYNK